MFDACSGGDVDGEVWCSGVEVLCLVCQATLVLLVNAEEDDLRDIVVAVVCLDQLLLVLREGVLADDGSDMVVLNIGKLAVAGLGAGLNQRLKLVAEEECGACRNRSVRGIFR